MNTLPNIEHIESLFKQTERFSDKEGKLFVPKILEAIDKIDAELVKLLLNDEKAKEQFFMKIDDVYVLNQNDLIEFFTMNEYFNHSFTSYTNKIGLIRKDNFIKKFDDVVLAFPYKDCVLEGGQTKEDDKKNEVFYNFIISRDEIDRLFEPKVLTNVKRYDENGEHRVEEIKEDDNLIIKGNNLLALHSLKKRYAGRVKLIYIDPPYNTGNDGFQYNDSFNHSTWLTFMKNRIEVAREFLSDDGVILVQISDNEQAYLKILMDEIFSRENFIEQIIWKKRSGAPNDKVIGAIHEYIIVFSLNKDYVKLNKKPRTEKQLSRYKNPDNHPKGKWAPDNLMANVKGGRGVKSLYYGIINPNTQEEHFPSSNGNWRFNKKDMDKLLANNEIYFGVEGKGRPQLKRFLCDLKDSGVPYNTIWYEDIPLGTTGTREIEKLFGSVNIFDTVKPEKLMYEIIHMSTVKNDLILDFQLGSGTTCAVAHKMGRRYIGIEQMDYIEDIAVERMKKVMAGEQGGLSKALEWSGGGSFIYAELKEIDNFANTPIAKLNKNMQYLPISELEDEDYNISDEEIVLNKKFYGLDDE